MQRKSGAEIQLDSLKSPQLSGFSGLTAGAAHAAFTSLAENSGPIPGQPFPRWAVSTGHTSALTTPPPHWIAYGFHSNCLPHCLEVFSWPVLIHSRGNCSGSQRCMVPGGSVSSRVARPPFYKDIFYLLWLNAKKRGFPRHPLFLCQFITFNSLLLGFCSLKGLLLEYSADFQRS